MIKENIYKNLSLSNLEGEVWKPVVGYEGLYDVSNLGRVKSFNRNGNNNFIKKFNSKRDLSREYNLDRKSINMCCKGLAKQHKGFIIKNDN